MSRRVTSPRFGNLRFLTPQQQQERQLRQLQANRYVVVKFKRQVNLPPLSQFPAWLQNASTATVWNEIETWLPDFRVEYAFSLVSSGTLASLVQLAEQRDPTYDAPKFENYLRVAVPAGGNAVEVASALRRAPGVELTYVEPLPNAPPVSDDDETDEQGYLEAASTTVGAESSIDARAAWAVPGGDGAKQGFVDLERGWLLDHDDLKDHEIEIISGVNEDFYTSHGTSVLGVVAAKDNTIGIVGIVPEVESVRVVGYCRSLVPLEYDLVKAIESAITNMEVGDVLLIEADNDFIGFGDHLYYGIPVEAQDAVYQAIRLGTALGIVIVEAGGDDNELLDDVRDTTGAGILRRSVRDSGAFLVAAASSTRPHRHMGNSSYGERIDFFAWGENVFTLADDPTTTSKLDYEHDFSETSAAAAIIAGAALSVQGMAEANLGHRLTPWALRVVLAEGGTTAGSAASPEPKALGVMPNLAAIISGDTLKLAPDVYLRDYVGDVGDVHDHWISASPDVIVTTASVADPQATWGEDSATEDDNSLGGEVKAGVDQYVYVRARNRGGSDATNVEATVYYSEVGTLITPSTWRKIGSTTIASIPSGDDLTVSGPIVWAAADVPASGHYCFIATVSHARDPLPALADLEKLTWEQFEAYIRNNNNVTWRNFNVVDAAAASGEATLHCRIAGPGGHDVPVFGIEIEGRLPRGAVLFLEAPLLLARGLRHALPFVPVDGVPDRVRLPLVPWSRNRLGTLPLGSGAHHDIRLGVKLPRTVPGRRYEVIARQTYRGREVGRVTWLVGRPG